jgi:hypothetical protein
LSLNLARIGNLIFQSLHVAAAERDSVAGRQLECFVIEQHGLDLDLLAAELDLLAFGQLEFDPVAVGLEIGSME